MSAPGARRRGARAVLLALLLGGCTLGALEVREAELGEGASYYWLGGAVEGPRTVFTPDDPRVTLAVHLAPNLIGYYQTFRVEWLAPGGGVYLRAPAFTRWGSHQELAVSLPLAGAPAARLAGRWRVRLYHGERLLVERAFELRAAGAARGAKEVAAEADQGGTLAAASGRYPIPDRAPEE